MSTQSTKDFNWHDKTSCTFKVPGMMSGGTMEVAMKRFSEGKLLCVITDGERFGNVISCQIVPPASDVPGQEGMMMMMGDPNQFAAAMNFEDDDDDFGYPGDGKVRGSDKEAEES